MWQYRAAETYYVSLDRNHRLCLASGQEDHWIMSRLGRNKKKLLRAQTVVSILNWIKLSPTMIPLSRTRELFGSGRRCWAFENATGRKNHVKCCSRWGLGVFTSRSHSRKTPATGTKKYHQIFKCSQLSVIDDLGYHTTTSSFVDQASRENECLAAKEEQVNTYAACCDTQLLVANVPRPCYLPSSVRSWTDVQKRSSGFLVSDTSGIQDIRHRITRGKGSMNVKGARAVVFAFLYVVNIKITTNDTTD